jgi:hypothetical protein
MNTTWQSRLFQPESAFLDVLGAATQVAVFEIEVVP